MSSTVEFFSGPRPASFLALDPIAVGRRYARTPPVVPEDRRRNCDSSSSVVDDGDGENTASSTMLSSRRQPLPFNLNAPPLDDVDVAIGGGDDLHRSSSFFSPLFLLCGENGKKKLKMKIMIDDQL